jgi:hypothetical protein
MRWKAACAAITCVPSIATALLTAGCTHEPAASQFLSPDDMNALVTGHTLRALGSGATPKQTLLYLAQDGTGWVDDRGVPGEAPRPGGMSMVFEWRAVEGSRVCLSATPLIGGMPSLAPARHECLQVLRVSPPGDGLTAAVLRDSEPFTGTLEVYPFNAFPAATVDQYLMQVRILYGGSIPVWPRYWSMSGPPLALSATPGATVPGAVSLPTVSKDEYIDRPASQPIVLQPR